MQKFNRLNIPDKASELASYSGVSEGEGGITVLALTLSVRLEKALTKLCRCSLRLLLRLDRDPLLKELYKIEISYKSEIIRLW